MPYVKANDPWVDADSATGGGDETTPLNAAELDHIEAGIATAQSTAETADTLIDAHLVDTEDAHDASAISVADAGGFFAGDDAEEVLAEIGAALAGVSGSETRLIPIDLRNPDTSGNVFPNVVALTDWNAWVWEYVKDVSAKVHGIVRVPDALAATANASIVLEIVANATSGVTRMQVASAAVADGESVNPASLTNENAQDITVPGTAYFRKKITVPLTLGGAPSAGDLLLVEVHHEGNHANDTLAVNTLLLGAWLKVDLSL